MRAILVYRNMILRIMLIKTHQDIYSCCGIRTDRVPSPLCMRMKHYRGLFKVTLDLPSESFLFSLSCGTKTIPWFLLVSSIFFLFPECVCCATVWWGFLPYLLMAVCRKKGIFFGSHLDCLALYKAGKVDCLWSHSMLMIMWLPVRCSF